MKGALGAAKAHRAERVVKQERKCEMKSLLFSRRPARNEIKTP